MFAVSKWNISSLIRRFAADRSGNVAMMFGLAVVPALLFAGAAIDYARGITEKERVQQALDATALAMAREPRTVTLPELQTRANAYFAASFSSVGGVENPTVTLAQNGPVLRLEATSRLPTAVMALAGYDYIPVRAVSEARNERKKLEIALVLDNTGSMGQLGKMPALKAAVNDLITKLQAKVVESDDVKMSIVPFNTEVRVSPTNFNAGWLRWDVTLENNAFGFFGRQPPTQAGWQGCISDRDQPYDASSEAPTDHFRRYVASKCHYSGLAEMMSLTTNLEAVRARANSMNPTGNTNVTIGLSTGLATLRSDSPFGATSSNASNVQKFLILLTDGDNTMNRWSNNSGQIDARLAAACTQARSGNVTIFTIRVIAGNATLLRNCATTPAMYYDVNDASQLQPAFQKILETIDGIRITS